MPVNAAMLVAHGTVEDLDELPEFLQRIRRGRPAPSELVEELRSRYEQIGGSPHLKLTRAQAAALEATLGLPVRAAMRLWNPGVGEVLAELGALGAKRVCVVPMAPYSVAVYRDAALESRQQLISRRGEAAVPELVSIPPWGDDPHLIAAHVDEIVRAAAATGDEDGDGDEPRTEVLLTAHSLPKRVIDAGDTYCDEFTRSANLIAAQLPWPTTTAYQSVGASGGAWVGPDLLDVMKERAEQGVERVVVAPVGFLTEHVETLYDLDIEAKATANQLGLTFVRVPALDTTPKLIDAIAGQIRTCLRSA
jgi:protoporphyrin/coproporphyrin ferrochelatase